MDSALAAKLTPSRGAVNFKRVLCALAECCAAQRCHELACAKLTKFTQCGEKAKAMRCLIQCGDTRKVISYARRVKDRECLVLAANYLQSLDWHSNAAYTKAILTAYASAKAYAQLAFFYDAMAQIEIDEYRDYDKALRALKQSVKQIRKVSDAQTNAANAAMFEERLATVTRFAAARKLAESDPSQMIAICEELIDAATTASTTSAVRVGDVFALMVEYHHSVGDEAAALSVMQRMAANAIILGPYLDAAMIEEICAAAVMVHGEDAVEEEFEEEEDID